MIELCRRLDQLPLAIELAAGQLRRFDLTELARRLEDRLGLLARRAPGDAPRHATMEATIDWSYRLLDPVEQCLLQQLSVFPSSFTVDDVEATAPALDADPVDTLAQLVDRSLVVRLPGTPRYRLLETIRVFAGDRLRDADGTAAARERHRTHVRDRAEASTRLDRWLSARLAAAHRTTLDDARQAFRQSLELGAVEDAVEIAVGASFLWRNAMGCSEGASWTQELLARELVPEDQLWVHLLRADVGQGRGDHRQMFSATAAAIELSAQTEDVAAACLAAHYGALVHLTDPDRATDRLAGAMALARESEDGRLTTLVGAFTAVGDLAAGRNDAARATAQALEPAASADGYDRFILHWAGWLVGVAEQDATAAWGWMGRQREFLDRTGIVETWITSLSEAMCEVVEGTDMAATLSRSLTLADREGYRADADCLLVLAYAELCAGRAEQAAELVGTAARGRFNATANYVLYRAVLDPGLRDALPAEVISRRMADGRDLDAAAVLAAHGITRSGGSARRPADPGPSLS